MADGYIFGNKFDSSTRSGLGQYYIIGRVKKVVFGPFIANTKLPDPDYTGPGDIGKIKYEILYSPLGTSKSTEVSEPAYPMFNFIKQYPTYGENVLIFPGPSPGLNDKATRQQFFYFPPYDLWNHVNHGAFPNLNEWSKYLNDNYTNKPNYSGNDVANEVKLPLGRTLEEKNTVRNLKPFEGDIILQARFGQSIRFGSTVPVMKNFNTWSNQGTNGNPITIIVNNQGKRSGLNKFDNIVEDINVDGSSIYLTHGQEINLTDLNLFPLASFGVSIDPIIQNVLEIQRAPLADETLSSQFQDENAIR
jgi:hypothetical protein